jgi:hypothetical protein
LELCELSVCPAQARLESNRNPAASSASPNSRVARGQGRLPEAPPAPFCSIEPSCNNRILPGSRSGFSLFRVKAGRAPDGTFAIGTERTGIRVRLQSLTQMIGKGSHAACGEWPLGRYCRQIAPLY